MMTKAILRRLILAVGASGFIFTGALQAQNDMQSNTRSATVYDGVTYEQLRAVFSDTVFNGAKFTVTDHGQPGGTPYFSLTSPQLPFAIYVSGLEEGYSGEGDGVYAGFALFTTMKLDKFTQADVNTFNYYFKFAKFSPGQTGGVFSVEMLMAGGASEQTMVTAFLPFLGGLSQLLTMASGGQTSVSYEERGGVAWSENGYAVQFADPPRIPAKISTAPGYDLLDERMIRDFVESSAASIR